MSMLGLSIETLRIDFRDGVAYGSLTQSYLSYIPDIPIRTSHRWGIPMETQRDPRNGGHQLPVRKSPMALGCSSGTNCWEALKLNQRCRSTSLQRHMENHYSRSSRARLAVLFTVTFPWHDFVYTHLYTQKSKHCMMKVHVFLWSNLCPPKKSAFHSSHRAEAQPPPQGRKHV